MIDMSNAIHDAYVRGDSESLTRLVGPEFWNLASSVAPIPLEYAIYHSPVEFVAEMIDLGADPNYVDDAGFPSLIAAMSSGRTEIHGLVELLLDSGADIQQRGVNGFTPLHYAAAYCDPGIVRLLLVRGADPEARTDVDDYTTPLEEARAFGDAASVKLLEQ